MCVTFEIFPGPWSRRENPWRLLAQSYVVPPSAYVHMFGLHKSTGELKSEMKETDGLHLNVNSFLVVHYSLYSFKDYNCWHFAVQ